MKIVAGLFGYVFVVAGLGVSLMYGMLWLVQPGPLAASTPRVAPIPPRIAESIERKKEPPAPPLPVVASEPMKASSVSLPQPPRQIIRELSAARPMPKPGQRNTEARNITATPPQPTQAIVTTARSDVPF